MSAASLEVQDAGTVRIHFGDQELELPVVEGSEGERGIDISALRKTNRTRHDRRRFRQHGKHAERDHLFWMVSAGVLRYRGYPIEELAANCDFVDVAYLC